MVVVHVTFIFQKTSWTREFTVEPGTSVLKLKELMLQSKGEQADMESFEFRRVGKRIPDTKIIWKDVRFNFKFLGLERGARRAQRDRGPWAAANPNQRTLTREMAISLQRDLYIGFVDEGFQNEMQALEEKHGKESRGFIIGRQALALKVQQVILPKYGFEGSSKGIAHMMQAMRSEVIGSWDDVNHLGFMISVHLKIAEFPQVEPVSVTVHWNPQQPELTVVLPAKCGASIFSFKGQLCALDPTGRMCPEDITLCDDQGQIMDDLTFITNELSTLRVK